MMTLDQLISSINNLLTRVGSNRVSGSDVLQSCLQIINYFASQLADIIPDWSVSTTFQTDGSDDGKFCKYADSNGRKRIFETKVDDNTNNPPPLDPNITENTYWKEVSSSAAAAIPEWAAGVYGPGLIIVFHNHSTDGRGLYVLLDPVRPYSSTNIETEIAATKWERIGGATGGGEWGTITGDVVDQADLIAYIAAQIAALVDSSPAALDTLNELAAALGDDANFASTVTTALAGKEATANKDASGGYTGLTLFKINFKNVLNTFTSFFTNSNTAARTYTFQDRNGTIADDTDLALKAPLNSPTFTGTPAAPTPADGDNSTKLATTAFVAKSNVGSDLYLYTTTF